MRLRRYRSVALDATPNGLFPHSGIPYFCLYRVAPTAHNRKKMAVLQSGNPYGVLQIIMVID